MIKRLLELAYKHKQSHLSSSINALPLIDEIYSNKQKNDPFILSTGHAGLALYVVLEKHEGKDAEELLLRHGTHPNRNERDGIYCSTGSLGQGLPIAVGMALANKKRNVYVLISDGECAEGSVWEALRVAGEQRLENLRVIVSANGFSALGKVDVNLLEDRLRYFYPVHIAKVDMYKYPEYLNGVSGHYHVLSDDEYKEVKEINA